MRFGLPEQHKATKKQTFLYRARGVNHALTSRCRLIEGLRFARAADSLEPESGGRFGAGEKSLRSSGVQDGKLRGF